MTTITLEQAKMAVRAFLDSQLNKKTEKEQKQLAKAIADGDTEKTTALQQEITEAQAKYATTTWVEDAATRMAKQLTFGTHISKGIHPDAKGDNVSFQPSAQDTAVLPVTLVGTHSLNSALIDANGNAAALPLAAFFDFSINDTVKIRDLILTDNADFIASLSPDKMIAQAYHQAFKQALQNPISQPVSHARNKQMLWLHNAASTADLAALQYTAIVPLYPSVLTHEMYQKINHLKYSDASKIARDNRFKKKGEKHSAYVSLLDLATVQLGGTKPQNVSQLMSRQGGRNYLLPSLPPIVGRSYSYKLSKFAPSIFNKGLAYHARHAIQNVFAVVNDTRKTVDVRSQRKQAIDEVLHILFAIATDMRTSLPPAWSKDYRLSEHEKLWLDPQRAEQAGEEAFKAQREDSEWRKAVVEDFARWLNTLLQTEFKAFAHDIGDPEHNMWEREIESMQKYYQRAGRDVFL